VRAWDVIRDVLATGTGLALIWVEVLSPHPDQALLVVAMVLVTPAVAAHGKDLLSGPGPRSSPPAPPAAPPESPPSRPD
jgi:hypothetical protein